MRTSYAIIWREGDGAKRPGKLELLPRTLRLESGSNGSAQTLELPYEELESVEVRRADDGVGSALALERRNGPTLLITTFAQPGIVNEIATRVGEARERSEAESVLVLLPVRPEALTEVRALIAAGPPFDPGEIGLDRHEVFVAEDEVAFVFHAPPNARALERLLQDPGLWEAAADWERVLTGPPRLAEHGYSWSRDRGFTTPPVAAPLGLGF